MEKFLSHPKIRKEEKKKKRKKRVQKKYHQNRKTKEFQKIF
jgi:hypothetical protein